MGLFGQLPTNFNSPRLVPVHLPPFLSHQCSQITPRTLSHCLSYLARTINMLITCHSMAHEGIWWPNSANKPAQQLLYAVHTKNSSPASVEWWDVVGGPSCLSVRGRVKVGLFGQLPTNFKSPRLVPVHLPPFCPTSVLKELQEPYRIASHTLLVIQLTC
jgi:hypothetical protein